ncbi:hypothetical protein GQ43DRAFT_439678 [Delitschia confertaspora ATCC 74209]|uniref:Uncharacterized protein n=1 Tax=Delitschia confertaspora ATCC 74209 TaxID=1513339 RepID=A0A9P4JSJ9_9PLEO|nr:hypothetical protein GQ43DRAFT_439678 [Delitschia confertaspora ATCC 74209]
MKSSVKVLVQAAVFLPFVLGLPRPQSTPSSDGLGFHTLTAYLPGDAVYDGLKVQYGGLLNLFQEKTGQYCPGPPLIPECPNGTDTVFYGLFYPVSASS